MEQLQTPPCATKVGAGDHGPHGNDINITLGTGNALRYNGYVEALPTMELQTPPCAIWVGAGDHGPHDNDRYACSTLWTGKLITLQSLCGSIANH